MKYCYKCKAEWRGMTQPGFKEACNECNEDLHVCLNCRFYDESKPYSCQNDIQEPVIDKARYNFCEEFQFADKPLPGKKEDRKDKTKERWDDLFKKN